MDLKEIERLLSLMKEHDLVEIELEDPEKGTRLRFKKAGPQPVANSPTILNPVVAAAPVLDPMRMSLPVPLPKAPEPEEEKGEHANLDEVPSPMVGTFYRASSPEVEAFVEVGDRIDEESVVCIIEAMKVMNEIKAEVAGEVVEILVHNGEAVEFGQPLFLVRTE